MNGDDCHAFRDWMTQDNMTPGLSSLHKPELFKRLDELLRFYLC